MGLFSSRPNVSALARRGDLAALRAAARYEDLVPADDGSVLDLGVPVRQQAVMALGDLAGAGLDEALAEALRDRSEDVRVTAVQVSAKRGSAELLAAAFEQIPPGPGDARELAITELLRTGTPGLSRLVAETLARCAGWADSPDEDLAIVEAAIDSEASPDAESEVIDVLVAALGDEREQVADWAEDMLVELAPASVERLLGELAHGRAPWRAASALGGTKDVRAVAPLIEALDRPDAELRAACCAALGELRDPDAVEPLLHAARDPDHTVRAQAGEALDKLGTVAVVVGVSALLRPIVSQLESALVATAEGRQAVKNVNGAN